MRPELPIKVVFWGTYDKSKPRVRLLLAGARRRGMVVTECHTDIWDGIEDKSQIRGLQSILRIGFRWLLAYPKLIWRYFWLADHDAVVVGYLGYLDVLALWLPTRLRRKPIFFDAFISMHETVVEDRQLVGRRSPAALLAYWIDWLACHLADKVFLDTYAHARYFEEQLNLPKSSVGRVLVGAETEFFNARSDASGIATPATTLPTVLFYGQFIPLHGADVIARAAAILNKRAVELRCVLIGTGQESSHVDSLIGRLQLSNVERIPWVAYSELPNWIRQADVCLGIFGVTPKVRRVVPNKVFQVLACGKPIITSDTPAMRELLLQSSQAVLIPAGSAAALATAIERYLTTLRPPISQSSPDRFGSEAVGRELEGVLRDSRLLRSGTTKTDDRIKQG